MGLLCLTVIQNLFSGSKKQIAKIAKTKNLQVVWYSNRSASAKRIEKSLLVPGKHNLSNALAAHEALKVLGVLENKILSTFAHYHGSWRRMEYKGKFHGAIVFDDYAHHPTEIMATLEAFREKYPTRRILCVFQPHQAKRLAALFQDFISAFDDADETLILPAYEVAGRDTKKTQKNSKDLVQTIQRRYPKKLLFYLEKPADLKMAILAFRSPLSEKVIVMMGAGNIADYTKKLTSG